MIEDEGDVVKRISIDLALSFINFSPLNATSACSGVCLPIDLSTDTTLSALFKILHKAFPSSTVYKFHCFIGGKPVLSYNLPGASLTRPTPCFK